MSSTEKKVKHEMTSTANIKTRAELTVEKLFNLDKQFSQMAEVASSHGMTDSINQTVTTFQLNPLLKLPKPVIVQMLISNQPLLTNLEQGLAHAEVEYKTVLESNKKEQALLAQFLNSFTPDQWATFASTKVESSANKKDKSKP